MKGWNNDPYSIANLVSLQKKQPNIRCDIFYYNEFEYNVNQIYYIWKCHLQYFFFGNHLQY